MSLFLFTYCTVLVHCAIGFHVNLENHPRNNNGLIEQLFNANDVPAHERLPRQSRFSSVPADNINQIFEFDDFQSNNAGGGGFDWYASGKKSNRNTQRPSRQSDFVFVDEDDFNDINVPSIQSTTQRISSATIAIPGMETTRSSCEDTCQATMQFDPICGDNNVTYTNIYWFRCAQRCGRNINIKHRGACRRVG